MLRAAYQPHTGRCLWKACVHMLPAAVGRQSFIILCSIMTEHMPSILLNEHRNYLLQELNMKRE